ncbi:Kinase/ NEK / Serine/threonine protein kinase [Giardia duodenalis assemblage B]|uniref:Kinase/ NEK / Serine/threonine protein kinase n=1 Tax=Giardia duodenalis assemblage B TaxID=1394984 RepID=A0A132NR97_GIAIN|nr:Kinase/ NEK / Serine/threonine protein kinase [Giardia intestinalis assemblage B]
MEAAQPSAPVLLPAPYVWMANICQTTLGCVCQAMDTSNNAEVTIKVVNYSQLPEDASNALAHEARALMYLNHDHVVRTYNTVITPETHTIYIIMEPCLGTLGTAIQVMGAYGRQISEDHIWCIAAEISSALKYLHEPHEKTMIDWYSAEVPVGPVVHGFLTPSDIFISRDGKCKIGGISPTQSAWEIRSGMAELGRFFLQAPEILTMQPDITEKVDIWSLGTTLFFIASFRSVWVSTNYESIVTEVGHGKAQRLPGEYSDELDSFIGKCLEVDPMYRPSVLELLVEPRLNDAMRSVRDGSIPSMRYLLGLPEELESQSLSVQPEIAEAPEPQVQQDPMNVERIVTPSGSIVADPRASGALDMPSLPTDTPTISTMDPSEMAVYAPSEPRVLPPGPVESDFVEAADKIVDLIAREACVSFTPLEDVREPVDMNILPASVTESIHPVPDLVTDDIAEKIVSEIIEAADDSLYTNVVDVVERLEEPEDSGVYVCTAPPQESSLVDSVKRLEDPVVEYEMPAEPVYASAPVALAELEPELEQEPESTVDVVDVLEAPVYEADTYEVAPIPAEPAEPRAYAGKTFDPSVIRPVENVTQLMRCVENNDFEGARYYIGEVQSCDSFGKTALMRAAELGNPELVGLLAAHEARCRDIDGWTALMFAVHSRNADCVRILADYESGMKLANGQTALMMASFWNNPCAVSILAEKESCMSTTEMYFEGKGFTALMEAARWGRHEIVKLLREREGKIYDASGKTALDHACTSVYSVSQADKDECIRLLSDLSAK